ncbi:MAG: HRDC domain-containing protein [Deltaproteobacteria bacterium]|nr:HRDC domain-containing protein [Deltaproteobacteria bacterium]
MVKIITLIFNSLFEGFDDLSIKEFCRDKEIISISDHFFLRNDIPYVTLIVKYYPGSQENQPKITHGKADDSWRKLLLEKDMGLFNLLRQWRSERSKKEGVPPYVLLTNRQLAEIIKQRPQTFAELEKIDGIGRAKVTKYGQNILEITKIDMETLPLGVNG